MKLSNVLVVEDHPAHFQLLQKLLEKIGVTGITRAGDGEEACHKMETAEAPFKLIISDMKMPKMSGLEFADRVRQDKRHYNVPFILVTAESDTDVIIAAKEHGVTAFLSKPFSVERFKERIELALSADSD
ncbi:MAG: response regulator [Alphaproteobacteria bacterium]|nr:response regulator [Alphaproteobacteria bacterium]